MKVDAAVRQDVQPKSKGELEKEALRARIAEKFGDKFKDKKTKPKQDLVELSNSAKKDAHIDPDGFGDIKKNDPKSESTQAKLKGLLRAGGFNFSEKERSVLSEILK